LLQPFGCGEILNSRVELLYGHMMLLIRL